MRIAPIYILDHPTTANNKDGLVVRSEQPPLSDLMEEGRTQLGRLQDRDPYFLEKIASASRVLIIEGISGSGKDTLQTYLKNKLEGRDVHDYSEGELLQSWKQLHIEGIFKLRVKFMKLFVNYVKEIVSEDENAVFLLNRFHLSTYASTIFRQPNLEREYDEIIKVLRTLHVHVFILQLDENEIEQRSLHPERSTPWQEHQKQIVKKDGFRDTLERHIWQQRLILEAAERQQIPYSVIKFPPAREIGGARVHVPEAQRMFLHRVPMNAADSRIPRRKRRVHQTVEQNN